MTRVKLCVLWILVALAVTPRAAAPVWCIVERNERFSDDFLARNAARVDADIVLQHGSLASRTSFDLPLTVEFTVRSGGQPFWVAFGDERFPLESSLAGSATPTVSRSDPGVPPVPGDHFVTVRQVLDESGITWTIDGVPAPRSSRALRTRRGAWSIANGEFSSLLVRSIRIDAMGADESKSSKSEALPERFQPPAGKFVRNAAFDDDFFGVGAEIVNGAIVTRGMLESAGVYSPPIAIEYRVKISQSNVRIGYGAKHIILDWEQDADELRIDGGPANGKHVKGKGRIPVDRFVLIRQVVLADRMEIHVDGELRAEWSADFSATKQPIRIFTHQSELTVESIHLPSLSH